MRRCAPATVSLLNVGDVRRKLHGKIVRSKPKHFKFKVGDHVRLSLRKHLFKKGYEINWTEEIFQTVNRIPRTPVVYEFLTYWKDQLKVHSMKKNYKK